MNLNGVHPNVIHAVNDLEEDEDDPQLRYVNLNMPINEREALFAVGFLHGLLSRESTSREDNQQETGLILRNDEDEANFSNEAVAVFCGFLQNTTLSALHLIDFPPAQLRRLLGALHTNASVKYLKLMWLEGDGSHITELLHHKTDFVALSFDSCPRFAIERILPVLRQGPAILQKLEFDNCALGNEGTHLLVDALVNSNTKYESLKKLSLYFNKITSNGLLGVSRLDASILPCLECLHLGDNDNLLDDQESTKLFAQKLLLSQGTDLKELIVWNSSRHQATGFTIIIKSMEKNETLRLLNIISATENFQPIRDQLILSLPKMKGLQQLHVGTGLLDLDDQCMMTAFRQNVSIFKVMDNSNRWLSDDPRLKPIITRNKQLEKLDYLLGTTIRWTMTAGTNTNITTTPTSSSTIPPPCGLWALVLAKVGQGCEGGSPVFKILRNRLATWVVPTGTAGNVTKKHSRRQEPCATQIMECSSKKHKQR